MLKTVPFQDRMEARHSDLNAIQSSARATFDTLVADAVTAVRPGYAGFIATKNSATELQIAPGRIYRPDGALFEMAVATTRNVTAILPAATKRLVAVIAYGQEEDSRNETEISWSISKATPPNRARWWLSASVQQRSIWCRVRRVAHCRVPSSIRA